MIQIGWVGDLYPLRTMVLCLMMTTLVLSRYSIQLWSHISPIESSTPIGNSGNMWAFLADFGKDGNTNSHV